MPKQRYYNLSYEKKQRIIKSTVNEMCRVPMNEMSINKIIQDANISRGSFYQYFDDKYDLIREVISGYKNNMLEEIVNFLTYKNKESLCKYRDSISATRIKTISNKIARLMESYFDAQEIAVLSQILKLAVVDISSDHIYYPTIPEEVVDIIERNGLRYE